MKRKISYGVSDFLKEVFIEMGRFLLILMRLEICVVDLNKENTF